MPFKYHSRGDDVILDHSSTVDYFADDTITLEVQSFAKRNVDETGRACDVFSDDEVTLLFRQRVTQ